MAKINSMLEAARTADCPPGLSGAARRRKVKLMNFKPSEEWTETEKAFMEYCDFIRKGRREYHEKQQEKIKADQTKSIEGEKDKAGVESQPGAEIDITKEIINTDEGAQLTSESSQKKAETETHTSESPIDVSIDNTQSSMEVV